jgi:Interferon-induced transmembrane protein
MAYDDRDDDEDSDDDLDIRKPGETVPNYLTQAILVTLCCCVPFGIVAIVNASQVNTFLARGDYEKAARASDEAKKWCWVGFLVGLPANILIFLAQLMAGVG